MTQENFSYLNLFKGISIYVCRKELLHKFQNRRATPCIFFGARRHKKYALSIHPFISPHFLGRGSHKATTLGKQHTDKLLAHSQTNW